MKTGLTSVSPKSIGGISAAVLVISLSFGGSQAVRAENPEMSAPALQEAVIAPLMRAVAEVAERLARVEASVASLATSVASKQVIAQQLCVSDDSGARTCITKAQLDALLRMNAQKEASQPVDATGGASTPTETAIVEPAQPEAGTPPSEAADHSQPDGAAQTAASEARAEPAPESAALAPAPVEEPITTQAEIVQPTAPAAAQSEPRQIDETAQAEPSQAEAIVVIQAGSDQPTEAAAAQDGAPQEQHAGAVPADAAAAQTSGEAPQTHAIATLSAAPQDPEQPVVTDTISSSVPTATENSEAPPEISAPETVPAME